MYYFDYYMLLGLIVNVFYEAKVNLKHVQLVKTIIPAWLERTISITYPRSPCGASASFLLVDFCWLHQYAVDHRWSEWDMISLQCQSGSTILNWCCVCVWLVHEKFSTVSSPVCDRGVDSSLVVVAERTNRILLVCQGCRFELTIVVIIQYSLQSTIIV